MRQFAFLSCHVMKFSVLVARTAHLSVSQSMGLMAAISDSTVMGGPAVVGLTSIHTHPLLEREEKVILSQAARS